jgi:hypothetical protein
MNTDQITAEQLAITSVQRVFAELQECKRLHENAGMTLPPSLMRVFGGNGSNPAMSAFSIPAPKRDHTPFGVGLDWISIPAKDASPTTVTLAILREQDRPIKPKVVVERVASVLDDTVDGSIYNLGKRLADAGVIESAAEGWRLLQIEAGGIMDGGILWAPLDSLMKPDLAAHRREAILHVLRLEHSGLQIVQIVEKLQHCPWMKAPANKDLLKADMQVLEKAGRAKLRGNSRKWEATG